SYETVLGTLQEWSDENSRNDTLNSGAFSAFWNTSGYDAGVASWLWRQPHGDADQVRILRLWRGDDLRYGENPHQKGKFFWLYDDPRITIIARVDGSATE